MEHVLEALKHLLIILKDYLIFINMIFAMIIIFFERRKPVFTLFWITILLLTSYFGFIMYLFFGIRFKKRRALDKYYIKNKKYFNKTLNESSLLKLKKWNTLTKYLEAVLLGKMTHNNHILLFHTADSFFKNLTEELKKAKKSIYMEYYIFDDDDVGKPIYDLLLEKVKEGVDVRVIIDGAGTRGISKQRKEELRKGGIKLEVFFPSYFPFIKIGNLRANYRNHRKITIVDNRVCFSGGLNIGNDYVGKGRLGKWQDIGFVLRGEAIADYLHEFERDWKFLQKDKKEEYSDVLLDMKEYPSTSIQVVSSGPNYEFSTMRDTFLTLVTRAERSIVIQTPYFIPDETILEALKMALVAGVSVTINIPSIGDHAFVYWANQYFYGELLEKGAKVYKYNEGFIHSKLMIVDEEVAFVGTANFDYRSMYQNFEISLLLFGEKVMDFTERVKRDIKDSRLVTIEEYKARGKNEKIKESISKLMAPLL